MKIQSIRQRMLATTMMGGVALAGLVALPVVAVVAAPTAAVAQDLSTGALSGSVTDQAGAPIAGATIELRSNEQGFARTTTTDSTGSFRSALLPLGTYTVTITAPNYDPVSQTAAVRLGGTSSYDFAMAPAAGTNVDDIVVTGARQSLDFSDTTTGLSVDLVELVSQVPIGRSLTSVILLAPSTVQGDSAFGDNPSIGGSSVAENAYYVNGLNITNFDNYIGASQVPFDFYRSVQVMTGGYQAEYGRATGGIVNAVTKSGTNDFTFGLHTNWAPKSLREQAPDTFSARNELSESESSQTAIEVGGPIIRDRLFAYGLVEFRDSEQVTYGKNSRQQTTTTSDDPFYGLKIDGYITDDHRLEFTYFDTTRESKNDIRSYDPLTDAVGGALPGTVNYAGGENWVARYTGSITDWFTISAAYGENNDRAIATPQDITSVLANDARDGTSNRVSQQTSGSFTPIRNTQRIFYRADADLYFSLFGDHHVRFGYDKEELSLERQTFRTGGYNLTYRVATAGTIQAQGGNLAPGQEFVETNVFRSGGTFNGLNEAYYIQDSWDVTEQLTVNLGLRLDKFAITGADAANIVELDEEIGPRIGFTYDLFDDGSSQVYGSYGRYYLPVAANTGFRMAGSELYYREYFLLGGYTPNPADRESVPAYGPDGRPLALGAQIVNWNAANACPGAALGTAGVRGCTVTGDGTVNPVDSLIAGNLELTMEDEFLIGYKYKNDLWTFGAAFTYRDLLRNAEDVAIDAAVLAYCDEEGIAGCDDIWTGFHQYVIINPGAASTLTLSDPIAGETTLRTINLTSQQLGYPDAKRTYKALELTAERAFDGVWSLNASYVISESSGNTEGYVKSDVGQTDAGITQDFDQPGLTDGSDGLLPNHRGHVFKLFGAYQLTKDLLVGANVVVSSPRAFGCLGFHPTDPFAGAYGAASYFCDGKATPRGTQLQSDWTQQIDLSVRYTLPIQVPGDLVFRADVFNVFDLESVTDVYEFGEVSGIGDLDPNYGAPIGYQAPRYVRLGFDWTF
ncbi:TonB-dependent receptor domain-containing protein [Brevundimonas sp. R86498]|uniref:TonB-dependent receptor n=1 Tax=Brevundimonas sp. R86498 TaxID=3093845 RepID=UPI0037C6026E